MSGKIGQDNLDPADECCSQVGVLLVSGFSFLPLLDDSPILSEVRLQ
ncbi:MAG: hypothetical protein AAFX90_22100 [Pseudomonadota bacterium]